MRHEVETRKTTMIEVISFLFFTLFAMILAFFTSAKAFAGPESQNAGQSGPRASALVAPHYDATSEAVRLPF